MKNKILIVVVAILSLIPLGASAQQSASQVLDKYQMNGAVPNNENRLGIAVNEINLTEDGKYTVDIIFGATKPQGNSVRLNPMNGADGAIPRFYVSGTAFPTDSIPAEVEKMMFVNSSMSFGSSPILGSGVNVTFATEHEFVLLCFTGITNDEISGYATPPLLFMIELKGKRSKLLDTKPYYLKELN
jgi:hypothetical protein